MLVDHAAPSAVLCNPRIKNRLWIGFIRPGKAEERIALPVNQFLVRNPKNHTYPSNPNFPFRAVWVFM